MFMLGAHTNSTKLQDPCTQVLSFRCQSGASHTSVTGIHLPALEAQNESEYQQKNIAGDFGTFFWAATHTVSCVAHSTNARSFILHFCGLVKSIQAQSLHMNCVFSVIFPKIAHLKNVTLIDCQKCICPNFIC